MVAVEVASETEIWSCVGTGIAPWLKGPISVTKKRRKTISFAIDHKQVSGLVIVKVGETHPEWALPCAVVGGTLKRAIPIPDPDGNRV
jgi:hypothetical protein